jgi:DnaJ-class molecular chaperone
MKDYYRILGVPHDCSQEDIKKAYRKLARGSHPDTCENKDGSKFREVQEAYDAIGSADKRRAYDNSLKENQRHVYFRPMSANERVPFYPVSIENFFEQMLGNVLRGDSIFQEYDEIDYQLELILTADEARTGLIIPVTIPMRKNCPVCGGTFYSIFSFCEYCHGVGHVVRNITAKVEIPPQVRNNSRFRIPIHEAGLLTITIFIQ